MKAPHFSPSISRRDFIKRTSATGALTGLTIMSGLRAQSPNNKLNIAAIGIGGRGAPVIERCAGENIVALCDVDANRGAETFKQFPKAKQFKDYRVMLDKMGKEIDAVIVATPDHTHAVATMEAMQRGKHVYTEKPLTHSIWEARQLTEASRKYKVATQMGNQGHSSEGARQTVEWIRAGVIGEVREVHCWSDRPLRGTRFDSELYWPQGVPYRPADKPLVPDTLDWDLWLGPAPHRPYHPSYVPFDWRGWWDFGTQAGTSYTFDGLQLVDSGTVVRVTASNGVDRPASSQATITVRPQRGCWLWASDGQATCGPCREVPPREVLIEPVSCYAYG